MSDLKHVVKVEEAMSLPSGPFETAREAMESAAKMMLKSRLEVMELQAEIDHNEQAIDEQLDKNQAILDRLVANG